MVTEQVSKYDIKRGLGAKSLAKPVYTRHESQLGDSSDEPCACGVQGVYRCGKYVLCEECSWALAECGGAP